MINTITLPPFKKMCVTIGNLPSSFVESMSYYEALCWMYNYLDKTVIPAINTEGEAITELQTAFTTLKTYVDNYFENLDVQEEINNKLDEMAESGELSDIIQAYLNVATILAFDNVSALKAADNLINGSFVKTYGSESTYDGFGRFYKIREKVLSDVPDDINIIALSNYENLVAEIIPNRYYNKLDNQKIDMERIFRLVESYQYQGACAYNSNIVLVGYDGSNSKAKILDSTGTLINEYTLQANTHCNSITFNTNDYMFYVANGDGTIDKYNTSFVFQERITLSNLYALTFYKNVMYGVTSTSKIYNFTTEEYTDLEIEIPSTLQSMVIYNDIIYVLVSNSNKIFAFNMDGKLLKTSTLEEGNGLYPYGECESLFVFNNKVYCNSICYASSSWRENFLTQIWITSIDNNIVINNGLSVQINNNLYVDATLRNNPTGYESNAFNYLSELSIIYSYRRAVTPQIVISDYIGGNKLYGIFNACITNNANKTINLNLSDSNVTLKTANNVASLFNGNIYFSTVRMALYCNFSGTCETCNILISDASTVSSATLKYSDVRITNNKAHTFTATNCTFNPITIESPTSENSVLKSILSMGFVRNYSVTFMLSGSAWDSVTVQINNTRHGEINSDSGLTIATSRGNIVLKTTGITQDANVYCYGIRIDR